MTEEKPKRGRPRMPSDKKKVMVSVRLDPVVVESLNKLKEKYPKMTKANWIEKGLSQVISEYLK